MNTEKEKLQKELKFIEESLRDGIITKPEYDNARSRVEEKLSNVKEPTEKSKSETKTEVKGDKEEQPELMTYNEKKSKKSKVRLETYGKPKRRTKGLFVLAAILVVVIIFFSLNSGNNGPETFTPVCSVDLDCHLLNSLQ